MSDTEARVVVKQAEFAKLYSDNTILVGPVRVSYPHFDKPWKSPTDAPDKKPKYGGVFLLPKKKIVVPSKDIIKGAISEILQAQKAVIPDGNRFLRDGDARPDKPAWMKHFTISANEERQPALRGAGRDPRTNKPKVLTSEEAAQIFYGGCWVYCMIRPWWQNNTHGKKVNANLLAVQYCPLNVVQKFFPDATDEAFGEGQISDEEIDESFGVIDDDDSGFDDTIGDDLDL